MTKIFDLRYKFINIVFGFYRLLSYSQILMQLLRMWNSSENHSRSRWYVAFDASSCELVTLKFCVRVKQVFIICYQCCCLLHHVHYLCVLQELQKKQNMSFFECQISEVTSILLFASDAGFLYTVSQKKQDIRFLTITLAEVN